MIKYVKHRKIDGKDVAFAYLTPESEADIVLLEKVTGEPRCDLPMVCIPDKYAPLM